MAPKHARDEQPRNTWPLNEAGSDPYASRRRVGPAAEQPDPAQHEAGSDGIEEPAVVSVSAATARTAPAAAGAPDPARSGLRAPYAGAAPPGSSVETMPDDGAPDDRLADPGEAATAWSDPGVATAGPPVADRTRRDERDSFERVGYGSVYQSRDPYADLDVGDTVLGGLHYAAVAPRKPVGDERWAASLRSFARAAVWCLPAAAVFLALSSVFGWPTATSEPQLVSPGTWVVVTALGLGLWLLGVTALAALVASSPVRPWGFVAVISSSLGVALLAPVVGVVGLARPAIARTASQVENDPNIAGIAARMQEQLLDHTVGRLLLVGGGVLVVLGAVAVVATILGSRVLMRHDGWLVLLGVMLAILAASLGWAFLFTLGAMVMLAGALGLAYTVSRIAPDGTPPPAY
jgi:hypothetical protein